MVNWLERGWQVFPAESAVSEWLSGAGPAAIAACSDRRARRRWLRHGGTWFVGVDTLPNGPDGAVPSGRPLGGRALDAARAVAGNLSLHRGQVSATFPGYPARDPDESDAAHRFRRERDAAHLDGLLPEGAERRRHLRERHAFILGIAVTRAEPGAAPLVVREGSHRIVRAAFAKAFRDHPAGTWGDIDMTEPYAEARREVFRRCPRREVHLEPGETVLVHRHAIHGVAPWAQDARAAREGRIIVYFRPEVAAPRDWLDLP